MGEFKVGVMSPIYLLDQEETTTELAEIGSSFLGVTLHPAAVNHLRQRSLDGRLPFPRLERHVDYLFGVVYVPSNAKNLAADYDRITFAATHDNVIASVISHGTSTIAWEKLFDEFAKVEVGDSSPASGQFILKIFRYATDKLSMDARHLEEFLATETWRILGAVDLTRSISDLQHTEHLRSPERRRLLSQLRALSTTSSELFRIMPRMRRVAEETRDILQSLKDNDSQRDLHRDNEGNERELFSQELEIHIADTYLNSRIMIGTLDEVDSLLTQLFEKAKQLSAEEHEAAGRFTGAIASIMLLPTFIVGLYGQNFIDMPETDWHYGYLFSWGAIISITVFQVVFFRRRRWI